VVRVALVVHEDLQGGTRRGLLSVFLHKKYIHSCSFYMLGSVNKFLNFCVAYFLCCFLKMAIKISYSHFLHVAFVSILVFQTFDQIIFGTLTFPITRWYVMTVRDTQMVRDQKKFENHCPRWQLSWVAVVRGGSCLGWQLPWVAVALGGSCPGWQLPWLAVVLVGSCPGWQSSRWQLSPVAVVPGGSCPGWQLPRW